MSQQVSEKLLNNNPSIDFTGLEMFGLVRNLPLEHEGWNECLDWFEYAIPPQNPALMSEDGIAKMVHYSSLSRGYIGHHELNDDGTLTLLRFEFPTFDADVWQCDERNTKITGDFWLILKEFSMSSTTLFVPFLDGVVISDEADWVTQHWPPDAKPENAG